MTMDPNDLTLQVCDLQQRMHAGFDDDDALGS